jgi:hypothetical protein
VECEQWEFRGIDVAKKPKVSSKVGEQSRLGGKILGPAADEFGKEVAPLGQRSGVLTTRVGHLLLDSVEAWVEEREKLKGRVNDEVAKKLENVSPEKIVPPNARIAAPALQGLSYSMDEEHIREMFLNLIAADMNKDTKNATHPGFAAIIKEMTSAEARALRVLKASAQIFYKIRVKSGSKWNEVGQAVSFTLPDVDFAMLVRSISNLDRLGVLEIRNNEHPIGPAFDAALEKLDKQYAPLKESLKQPAVASVFGIGENLRLEIKKDGIFLTPIGVAFCNVCLSG